MRYLKAVLLTAVITAMSAHAQPVFNIFELGVQADKATAYDTVGENNITRSITNEPGTLSMVSVKDKENPNLAYMIEIYADDAAYRTHLASPQYKVFAEQAPSILTDHKLRLSLTAQYLGDKGSLIKQNGEMITNMVRINVLPGDEAAFKAAVMAELLANAGGIGGELANARSSLDIEAALAWVLLSSVMQIRFVMHHPRETGVPRYYYR